MRPQIRYRYFLASLPDLVLRAMLVGLRGPAGQFRSLVKADQLHLTWCVLAETMERLPFLAARVDAAFADDPFVSGLLQLGRVRGGKHGAAVHSRGRKPDVMALYCEMIVRLATRDLHPKHRKSGLKPHFTLGYDTCAFEPFLISQEWIPDALLLIESDVGKGIHNILGRWPLLPPRQGLLPFDPPAPPAPLLAAGG
jgi:hypothetical protein